MASTVSALRVLAFGPLLGLGVAGGMTACGGSSVKHVDDGETGSGASGGTHQGGSGGTGSGATPGTGGTGGSEPPLCRVVGEYAGDDYVDWNLSPGQSCAGATEWCFEAGSPTLRTCMDAGSSSAPPAGDAPYPQECFNVRDLCSTTVGCCEDVATLVAGPRLLFVDLHPTQCCYLALRGPGGR